MGGQEVSEEEEMGGGKGWKRWGEGGHTKFGVRLELNFICLLLGKETVVGSVCDRTIPKGQASAQLQTWTRRGEEVGECVRTPRPILRICMRVIRQSSDPTVSSDGGEVSSIRVDDGVDLVVVGEFHSGDHHDSAVAYR